ncbi:hypothetical protein [Bradyrhizobium sp. USDA 223]|uniref:hypothetical protein n=1 Tax=Bradyrhizobium sp. USDA 223 TaxID=3156306 RepID=UPI0038398BF7
MPKVVIVPNTPLMESDGSFGHHVAERGQHRAESDGSFGRHTSSPPIPMAKNADSASAEFVLGGGFA